MKINKPLFFRAMYKNKFLKVTSMSDSTAIAARAMKRAVLYFIVTNYALCSKHLFVFSITFSTVSNVVSSELNCRYNSKVYFIAITSARLTCFLPLNFWTNWDINFFWTRWIKICITIYFENFWPRFSWWPPYLAYQVIFVSNKKSLVPKLCFCLW